MFDKPIVRDVRIRLTAAASPCLDDRPADSREGVSLDDAFEPPREVVGGVSIPVLTPELRATYERAGVRLIPAEEFLRVHGGGAVAAGGRVHDDAGLGAERGDEVGADGLPVVEGHDDAADAAVVIEKPAR
jgi:hypothetical protein